MHRSLKNLYQSTTHNSKYDLPMVTLYLIRPPYVAINPSHTYSYFNEIDDTVDS